VRGLIEEQHAAMLKKLHAGGFDAAIVQRLGRRRSSRHRGGHAAGVESRPDTEPTSALARGPRAGGPRPSAAPRPVAAAPHKVRRGERSFGEGLGSQKPLDEVILDYLAEKARERAPERTAGTAARKSRPSG
jgi:hypothetical protein